MQPSAHVIDYERRFGGVARLYGRDAAHPDNAEMRLRDGFGAVAAVKTGYTAEAAFIVDDVS